MSRVIQRGLVLLVFVVPLIFSRVTTEVYGLIKVVVLEVGVLALLGLWLVKITNVPRTKDTNISRIAVGPLGWAIFAFFCVAILSLIRASNIHEGVKSIYQLGAGVGLFLLIVNNVKEKKGVNEIVLAIVLAGVIASLFSLYENRGIKFGALRFAYTSTFGNPIFFAQYISLAIPISVAMCLQKNSVRHYLSRVFFGLSASFMLVFLLLTRSRGAYLGVAVAFLYCYIVLLLHCSKKLRKVLIGVLIACLIASSVGLMCLPQLKGLVGENIRFRNLIRVYLWGSTFRMVKDHPILGVGAGNFKVIYPLYRSAKVRETIPKGVKYSKAHNDFLQIWAEMGTLGLICFLWILFSLAPRVLYPLPERTGPSAHISLGLSAGIIALLVQAFFNPLLYVPASGMGFWTLLGLIALEGR